MLREEPDIAKLKTRIAAVPVPQDDSECRTAIREIGDLSRELGRIEAAMNDRVAKLQEEHGEKAAPRAGASRRCRRASPPLPRPTASG